MKSVLPYARGLNLNSPNDWPKLCINNTESATSLAPICDGTFTMLDFDSNGVPRFVYDQSTSTSKYYFFWLAFSTDTAGQYPLQGRWGITYGASPNPYTQPIGCLYVGPTEYYDNTKKILPILNQPNTYLNYPRLVYTGQYQYCDIASGPC
jgi:hypothetical protein